MALTITGIQVSNINLANETYSVTVFISGILTGPGPDLQVKIDFPGGGGVTNVVSSPNTNTLGVTTNVTNDNLQIGSDNQRSVTVTQTNNYPDSGTYTVPYPDSSGPTASNIQTSTTAPGGDYNLSFSAFDNSGGTITWQWRKTSGGSVLKSGSVSSGNSVNTTITNDTVTLGQNQRYLYLEDPSDNSNTYFKTVTAVDEGDPYRTDFSVGQAVNSDTYLCSFRIYDNASNNITWRIKRGSTTVESGSGTNGSYRTVTVDSDSLNIGNNSRTLELDDNNGNTKSYSFTVVRSDTQAPYYTILPELYDYTQGSTTYRIRFRAEDTGGDGSGGSYQVRNGPNGSGTLLTSGSVTWGSVRVTSFINEGGQAGEKTRYVRVFDESGNVVEESVTITFSQNYSETGKSMVVSAIESASEHQSYYEVTSPEVQTVQLAEEDGYGFVEFGMRLHISAVETKTEQFSPVDSGTVVLSTELEQDDSLSAVDVNYAILIPVQTEGFDVKTFLEIGGTVVVTAEEAETDIYAPYSVDFFIPPQQVHLSATDGALAYEQNVPLVFGVELGGSDSFVLGRRERLQSQLWMVDEIRSSIRIRTIR